MRLIGLLLAAVVLAIALWLVFVNPRLGQNAPISVAPAVAPPVANAVSEKRMAEEAAQKAQAASRAKAAKAKAEALAAQHAAEAAQAEAARADAIEQTMTPAQNRINEDYAAQVGDTRPAADAGNASASPDRSRP